MNKIVAICYIITVVSYFASVLNHSVNDQLNASLYFIFGSLFLCLGVYVENK